MVTATGDDWGATWTVLLIVDELAISVLVVGVAAVGRVALAVVGGAASRPA
jgi:hypothetical protein